MKCTRCPDDFPRSALTDYHGELICPRDLHSIALQQMAHPTVHIPTVPIVQRAPDVASGEGAKKYPTRRRRVEPVTTNGGLI